MWPRFFHERYILKEGAILGWKEKKTDQPNWIMNYQFVLCSLQDHFQPSELPKMQNLKKCKPSLRISMCLLSCVKLIHKLNFYFPIIVIIKDSTKGQIISKCLFGIFNFFQKQKKTPRIVVKMNSFVRFLEEFMAWQFAFEINWPLRHEILGNFTLCRFKICYKTWHLWSNQTSRSKSKSQRWWFQIGHNSRFRKQTA